MTLSEVTPALSVVKRDGRVVPFDRSRIERAIERCLREAHPALQDWIVFENKRSVADAVAGVVIDHWGWRQRGHVTVEEIQDLVEKELLNQGLRDSAKAYMAYRDEHARQRIPEDVKAAFAQDEGYFPTPLQRFQFLDKYSRWNSTLGRRETWVETVDRTVDFLYELAGDRLERETYERIRRGILEMRVMPSMRLLAMAGAPARRQNASLYNCSFVGVDDLRAFSEALLISMAGCGVGFSVEEKYTGKLPAVDKQRGHHAGTWLVEDSAEGWAKALEEGLHRWFFGHDIAFDLSLIRPAGAILRTKGGRASGPEPLEKLLAFCRAKILSRQGSRLRPLDVHDMMCAIGQGAVSGGVRRTALISLFDDDDQAMLHAKDGNFAEANPQRWNANNSVVTAMDDPLAFTEQFLAMLKSGRGEPGLFNPQAALATMPSRRSIGPDFGTNPCAEILLRSKQFCNLSAAIVRADDTYESLNEKVELATIIGTIQSLATHFPGLRPEWKANCEEERLLGVDITGQQDNPALLTPRHLQALRSTANWYAARTAERLGIVKPAAITCVKPSGNTSQLVDCASGLHARWAPYYIRNVRVSASSPIARVLKDAGVPMAPENGDDPQSPRTWVVSFPVKAPDGAVTRNGRTALEQCEWWLQNKRHYTEHNPSVTITYRPDEVIDLMKWVWDHREMVGGMAFLPSFDAAYDQLPYIEIDQAEYERRAAAFPKIQWEKIYRYEAEDYSTASTTLACEGDRCVLE